MVAFDLRAAIVLVTVLVAILVVSVLSLWRTTKFN
jgi:hypothetical protein